MKTTFAMKSFIKKLIGGMVSTMVGLAMALPLITSAQIVPTLWSKIGGDLFTNPQFLNIHVAGCFIGAGYGTPCGSVGGGIVSINGDVTPAQLISAGAGISVATVGGNTTITNTAAGTITGGGAVPQVTLWTGATSIGGDSEFTFDTTISRLLVGDTGALFDLNPNTQQAVFNVGTNGFLINNGGGSSVFDAQPTSMTARIGDVDSIANDTVLTVNDAGQIIDLVSNNVDFHSVTGSDLWGRLLNGVWTLGDVLTTNNSTALTINDTAQLISGEVVPAPAQKTHLNIDTIEAFVGYSDSGTGGKYGFAGKTGGSTLIYEGLNAFTWPSTDSTGTQALVSNGAGALGWQTIGTGTIGGTVAATEVAYGSGVNTITSDSTFTRTPSNFTVQTLNGGNTAEIQIDANTPFFNIFSSDGTNTAGIGSGTTFLELTNNDGVGNSTTWLWPQTDSQPGDVLTTDGSGNLSFAAGGSVDTSNAISVSVATTTILPGAPTYNNGVSGVGATLTRTGNGALGNIDGQPTIVADRILVKNQVATLQNGVYEVTQVGDAGNPYILTRTTDSDLDTEFDDQVVVPTTGTTQVNQIFGQTTETPLIGTDPIVYVTVTNTYVTQSVTGTQTNGNIPFWTNNPRQLNRGNSRLAVPGNTWLNSMLRLGGGTQGGRMVFRSGTNVDNVFIGYNDATTANVFNFNNVSAGGEMRNSIAGTTSMWTLYSNSGVRVIFGDQGQIMAPYDVAAGSTFRLAFRELAANGTNFVGFKAPDLIGSSLTWTLPATDSTGTQALVSNGSGTLSWSTIPSGGVTTLAAIGASPNANGATISGTTLNLQPADASFGGVVTTGSQQFAGSKTFLSQVNIPVGSSLVLGDLSAATGAVLFRNSTNNNTVTIQSGVSGANYTLTLPTSQSTGTQALVNDGSGTLSWATTGSGNVTGSGTSPRIPYWSSATALIDDAEFTRVATQGITLYDTGAKFNTFINGGNTTGAGTDNVGIGRNAIDSLTTGTLNIAIGKDSGTALNNGSTNILIGDGAGGALISGSDNVFIGHLTGNVATSSGNVGVGNQVMSSNVGGNDNTALGASALSTNISGNDNVAIGSSALTLSTATGNTAVGNQSLFSNAAGANNTAVGNQSLGSITGNSGSTAVGATALLLTTGGNNTGLGSGVGGTLTTGTGNTLIGQAANVSASSTTDAIALGRGATAASNEFAIMDSITNWKFQGDSYTLPTAFPASNGYALTATTAGVMSWANVGSGLTGSGTAPRIPYWSSSTALADDAAFTRLAGQGIALEDNSTNHSLFIGFSAGNNTSSGLDNIAMSLNAGDSLTSGSQNLFIGRSAGTATSTSSDNVFLGYFSGSANVSGASNVYIGSEAGRLNTAGSNVVIGKEAGETAAVYANATMVGFQAGQNASGSSGVFLGYQAGQNVTGNNSIYIGQQSGATITSGLFNLFIGLQSDGSTSSISNSIVIGQSNVATANQQLVVGNKTTVGASAITQAFFGEGVTDGSPTTMVFNATGGSGTDIAAAPFVIAAGRSTGSATPASVRIQTGLVGTTGTTAQTLADIHEWTSLQSWAKKGQRSNRTAVADTDYTILLSDYVISYTSLSAARTVTVPDASTVAAGTTYIIKDAVCDSATDNIILDPAGTDTIDTASTFTMNVNCMSITIMSDGGTNWEIL